LKWIRVGPHRSRGVGGLPRSDRRGLFPVLDNLIDQTIVTSLGGAHDAVALDIALDGLDRLSGMVGEDLIEPLTKTEDLFSGNLDIGRLTGDSTRGWLVNQDA